MLLIYTGKGKGKTCAAVGQAIRAYGHGLGVVFGQFVKRDIQAGEQVVLKQLLGENFLAGGLGFLKNKDDFEVHANKAKSTLQWIIKKIQRRKPFLAVLDESLYALGLGYLTLDEIWACIEIAQNNNVHLLLTGRELPYILQEKADLVSHIEEVKHHYAQGIVAQRGIEF
ncbi:MAG: cob(I)yrinic acid a,c-diamide adenosyltransferase [Desulfonauticus sp.]|nr:cob(I)yrinic acid a,c-diamide adenosyltransferase [Desulfonauticus sp.]